MSLYYKMPAHLLKVGVSTDDGQEVLSVDSFGDFIMVDVYTPRLDRPDLDEHNSAASETRCYHRDQLVGLARFDWTAVDLSGHEQAQRFG